MILGDTSSGNANTEVAKISLKINSENVSNKENTTIRLKDMIITDGNFEVSTDKQITINLTSNDENVNTQKVQQIKEITSISGEETIETISSTTQKSTLPNAGMRENIIIAIVVLIIFTIIFKIKSRKIKY